MVIVSIHRRLARKDRGFEMRISALLLIVACCSHSVSGYLFERLADDFPDWDVSHFPKGYYEGRGDWKTSLLDTIDQIKSGCGLNSTQVVVVNDGTTRENLRQSVFSGVCQATHISSSWSDQLAVFDPLNSKSVLSSLQPWWDFRGSGWMPLLDFIVLSVIDVAYDPETLMVLSDELTNTESGNFGIDVSGNEQSFKISMFSMIGFDDRVLRLSINDVSTGSFGNFPQFDAASYWYPFPGWNRWTQKSVVLRLGMIWTYLGHVYDGINYVSTPTHIEVDPVLLWRYSDLYTPEGVGSGLRSIDFHSGFSPIGFTTQKLMTNRSYKPLEDAFSSLPPVKLTIETRVEAATVLPDLSHMKVAWLNMTDNTWVVLCNTTVVNVSCGGGRKLIANVSVNASLFFDYARNDGQWSVSAASDSWRGLSYSDRQSFLPPSFNIHSAKEGTRRTVSQMFTGCTDNRCDKILANGGACSGCGGRFELFTFAGCYRAQANQMLHPEPFTVISTSNIPLLSKPGSAAPVNKQAKGCDYRIIPNGVPSSDTCVNCAPAGFVGKVVIQPGFGFRAIIDPGTFSVTVGIGMCVTPYYGSGTGVAVPDVNSVFSQVLCSDMARLYFDAAPQSGIMVTIPMQYVTGSAGVGKDYMAIGWFSVRQNSWTPTCSNVPVADDSLWLKISAGTLKNPEFTNGPKGCDQVQASFLTPAVKNNRCDGYGARVACMRTTRCKDFQPPCSSAGMCYLASEGTNSFVGFGGAVAVLTPAGAVPTGTSLSLWWDELRYVRGDSWSPLQITEDINPAYLPTVAPVTEIRGNVVRILFSSSVVQPIVVTISYGSSVGWLDTFLYKLAWYDKSTNTWTPLCNSTTTADGNVTATLGLNIVRNPSFADFSQGGLGCTGSPIGVEAKLCQKGGLVTIVWTPWSVCYTGDLPSPPTTPGATPMNGTCNAGTFRRGDDPVIPVDTGTSQGPQCQMGLTKGVDSESQCSPCGAGTYKDVPGNSACKLCGKNTYSTATGAWCSSTCLQCPPESGTQDRVGQTSCVCNAGFEMRSVSWPNSWTPFPGVVGSSTSFPVCTPCAAGKYKSADGAQGCVDCEAGTYQPAMQSTICTDCAPRSTSLVGSALPEDCECNVGYRQTTLGGTCDPCPSGTYKNVTGNAWCTLCDVGFYSVSTGQSSINTCVPCVQGKSTVDFGSNSEAQCICAPGYRDSTDSPTGCVPCEPGTYKEVIGNGGCQECARGFYNPSYGGDFLGACLRCPLGSINSGARGTSLAECTCQAGYGLDGYCKPCSAGFYSSDDIDTCLPCPQGTYSATSMATSETSCGACPANSRTEAEASSMPESCKCNLGYSGPNGGPCQQCGAGTYSDTSGPDPCTLCPLGTYSTALGAVNGSNCKKCGANLFTLDSGSSRPEDCWCNLGYEGVAGGACTICGAGKYSNVFGPVASCTMCKPGSYSSKIGSEDSTDCISCMADANTSSFGSSSVGECICRAGYQKVNGTSCANSVRPVGQKCQECSIGYYMPPWSSSCLPCPVGTYSSVTAAITCVSCPDFSSTKSMASAAFSDCRCMAGYESTGGLPPCTPCNPGTYKINDLVNEACISCPKGYYGYSTTACLACPTLAYSTTASIGSLQLSDCICQKGAGNVGTGVECEPCQRGTYYTLDGSRAICVACSANKYDSTDPGSVLDRTDESRCRACPANSISPEGSSSVRSCTCIAGYYFRADTGKCAPCISGYYSLDNATACTICSVGTFSISLASTGCENCAPLLTTLNPGATSEDECGCPCGTYKDPITDLCVTCGAGTYGSGGTTSSCTPCTGTEYSAGAGACRCDLCPQGAESTSDGASCVCMRGFVNNSDTRYICTACPAGKHVGSSPNSNRCVVCEQDKYNPVPAQIACLPCPEYSHVAAGVNTAISQCVCEANYDRVGAECKGQTGSQTTPPPDSTGDTGSGDNVAVPTCSAGWEVTATGSCKKCDTGYYKPGLVKDSEKCKCCPADTYNDHEGSTSSDACSACPLGTVTQSAVKTCGGKTLLDCVCTPGYNGSSGVCTPCETGHFSADYDKQICDECPMNFYQDSEGGSQCKKCPAGTMTETSGSKSIIDCKCTPGYISDGSGSCVACAAGTYMDGGICVKCLAGKFSVKPAALSSSVCKDCNPDSTTDSDGASQATDCKCNAGFSGPDGGICDACDAGSYKSVRGSSECIGCAMGTYQSASGAIYGCDDCPTNAVTGRENSESISSCLCGPGYEFNGATQPFSCSPCNKGQWKSTTTNTADSCLACPAGTYNPELAATSLSGCIHCPAGTNTGIITGDQGYTDLTDCSCNKGFSTLIAGHACTVCGPGTYKSTFGTGECVACGTGYWQPYSEVRSFSSCQQCPPGSWTEQSTTNDALTDCVCKPGFTAECNGVSCFICPAGTYKSLSGSSSCIKCPRNTYSGTVGADSSSYCTPCGANSATLDEGQKSISRCLCAPGYTGKNGEGTCTACPAGKYKKVYGSDPCIPCGIGSYSTVSGASKCTACEPNAVTEHVGSTASSDCMCDSGYTRTGATCSKCVVGKYKINLGNFACTDCEKGFYSTVVGMMENDCKVCPSFSTTVGTGSGALSDCFCGQGLFDNRTVKSATTEPRCIPCPRGTYRDESKTEIVCSSCPIGKYSRANSEAVLVCELCPANQLTAWVGVISSIYCYCGPGFYSTDRTSGTCELCQPGTYSDTVDPYPCTPCPAGTYQPASGATLCIHCPEHSVTTVDRQVNSVGCVCAAGYYMGVGDVCVTCGAGKYKSAAGNGACQDCHVGTFASATGYTQCTGCATFATTESTGSNSGERCTCNAGYKGSNDIASDPSTSCVPCPQGSYKSASGSGECVSCAVNLTTWFVGSSSEADCNSCKQGEIVNECDGFQCYCRPCRNCTLGQYLILECNPKEDTVCANCSKCSAGEEPSSPCDYNHNIQCSCCSEGSYSAFGEQCLSCGPGTFSTSPCSTSCELCQAGTYHSENGKTSPSDCEDCSAGTYQSDVGKSSCLNCGHGSFQNLSGSTECQLCSSGTYSIGFGRIQPCSCCEENSYQDLVGKSFCTSCAEGKFSFQQCCGSENCCSSCSTWSLDCSAPNEKCSASAFRYQTQNNAWEVASQQVGSCPACPIGSYLYFDPADRENPTKGSLGYPSMSFANKDPDSGVYVNSAEINGVHVDTQISVSEQLGIVLEDHSTFQNSDISLKFNVTSIGPSSLEVKLDFMVGGNNIQLMLVRLIIYGLNQSDQACRVFRANGLFGYQAESGIRVEESQSDVLFRGPLNPSISSENGFAVYYNVTTSISIKIEANGLNSDNEDNTIILSGGSLDAFNFESPPPLNPTLMCSACRCIPCGAGKYSSKIGSLLETDCEICDVGSYVSPSKSGCIGCPQGTYLDHSGGLSEMDCLKCNTGSYSSTIGATACIPCPESTFSNFSGATSINDCTESCNDGEYMSMNGLCIECAPGSFSQSGKDCQLCEPGSYSAVSGSSTCQICLSGENSFYAGGTRCYSATYFLNFYGKGEFCPECTLLGWFSTPCLPGSYAAEVGATACLLCLPGSFSSEEGRDQCTFCEKGTYSSSHGASTCTVCESGTFSTLIGANSSNSCHGSTSSSTALLQTTSIAPTTSAPPDQILSTPSPPTYASCVSQTKSDVGNFLCSGGSSLLNYFCSSWRDSRFSMSVENQKKFLAKCMAQDCQQSLESNNQGNANYCRFVDSNGLCYAYKEAQLYCGRDATYSLCNSGGDDWAISPVGTAASLSETRWTPKSDAVLEGPAAQMMSQDKRQYSCSCLKNCACSNLVSCWCASNSDKVVIGSAQDFSGVKFNGNLASKKGMCACSCGGVLGI